VISNVQFDDMITVLLGKEAGGHTFAHSVVVLAKRHRTTSLSASIVGINNDVRVATGI
jgi:hypothetical protein